MGVVWVLTQPDHIDQFDQVLVFRNGAIVERGAPTELKARNGVLAQMVA
jgi:ABC-type multidrug transport system fused ATPase/permease subunit